MRSILFFHNNNDYTGSTRVLANVISSEYADKEVHIVVNKNHGRGFLSELPNVRMIGFWQPLCHGRPIPILSALVVRLQGFFLTLIYGWCYETFYINTIVPFYAALVGRLYGKRIVYHIHEKFVSNSLSVRVMESVFTHTVAKRIYVSEYTMSQYARDSRCEEIVRYNKLGSNFMAKVRVRPLSELVPEYHFRLILSASKEAIDAFISEPIPTNVEFIPEQSDIHPYLYSADLMLNMSVPFLWIETFGMTILEAMAYGIPSIVPNLGGPTELIEDDYNGYCVDVTDVELVASKVRFALDRVNYERLCVRSLERFERFK